MTTFLVISIAIFIVISLLYLVRLSNKPTEERTRAFGPPWTGKVVKVMDGDTIRALNGDVEEKVRLFGIDAPEKKQDYGDLAREFTAQFCLDKTVSVMPISRKDLYGRTVGIISVDNQSLNEELLRHGFAWWYQSLAKSRKDYGEMEKEARDKKIGVWSQPDPVAPWTWRKLQKGLIGRAISWVKAEDYYYD